MGFFKSFKNAFHNKYADHPDVLDRMAKTLARWAMEQLRDDIKPGCQGETFVRVEGGWSLSLDTLPERCTYRGDKYTCYGLKYNDYGMEDVPDEDAQPFLSAFCPFFDKHCKAIVKNYFPSGSAIVALTTYDKEHRRDTDYDTVPAIRLRVYAADKPEPPKPTYTKW